MQREVVTLSRDTPAILIPDGNKISLEKGTEVIIHQTLGGSYTVTTDLGYLARIDGKDADSLGKEPVVRQVKEPAKNKDEMEKQVWDALKTVYDPEIPVNIVDLGLVYLCEVSSPESDTYHVKVRFTLTAPGCGMGGVLASDLETRVKDIPKVTKTDVEVVFDPPWDRNMMSESARLELGM